MIERASALLLLAVAAMTRRFALAGALAAAAGIGLTACQVGGRAATAGAEKHGVEYLAYNIERHKGQTIRTCGSLMVQSGQWRIEAAPSEQLGTLHGRPAVLIVACPGERPSLDGASCITGRVARRDGSLSYPLGAPIAADDVPTNYEWFLHPRCPVGR